MATAMLTMSVARRLTSAGLPAPSITTRSFSAMSAWSASRTTGHSFGPRPIHGSAVMAGSYRPMTMTWLKVSALGLRRMGLWRASGVTRAARACRYWARPISAPSGVTAALLLMFWALNGATRRPRSA